jgi:hypothetical protein
MRKTPVKKKGARRTEIQTPDLNAEPLLPVRESSETVRSTVGAGEIKRMVNVTVWRVMNEIYPGFENIPDARLNSDEFAYVLMLAMLLGYEEQYPRKGLRIKRHEFGSAIPLCREHS